MRKHLITAAVLVSCAAATSAYAVDVGANTTVGGVAFFDFSNISETQQQANGTSHDVVPSGTGFDVKRFYLVVDHVFNDVWSADLTTDAQFASAGSTFNTNGSNGSGGVAEVFVKKLYLTGKFADAFIIHVGAYDTPWISVDESAYGYRFVEKTIGDRLGFLNTADWGVNASGSFANNLVSYSASVLNGGGYKNPTRTKDVDFEGRVAIKPVDWLTVAVGGYTGHIGQVTAANDGNEKNSVGRIDGLIAANFQGFRLGVEFLDAMSYKTVNSSASFGGSGAPSTIVGSSPLIGPPGDKAIGFSAFTSYAFTPEWAAFARYDDVKLSKLQAPNLKDQYFNVGVDYKPYKAVDIALVYKNEKVNDGAAAISSADANSSYTIGGVNGTTDGKFSEIGVYFQYRF